MKLIMPHVLRHCEPAAHRHPQTKSEVHFDATLFADDGVCYEHMRWTEGNILSCCVGVQAGQALSFEISFDCQSPELYVDVIVDGIFRRMKHYKKPFAAERLIVNYDSINQVWCRSQTIHVEPHPLGWSRLVVDNIALSGSHQLSPEDPVPPAFQNQIGCIELQLSLPSSYPWVHSQESQRTRTGRSFEQDANLSPQVPMLHPSDPSISRPTHKIDIARTSPLDKACLTFARSMIQTVRPGKEPFATLRFFYRATHLFVPMHNYAPTPNVYQPKLRPSTSSLPKGTDAGSEPFRLPGPTKPPLPKANDVTSRVLNASKRSKLLPQKKPFAKGNTYQVSKSANASTPPRSSASQPKGEVTTSANPQPGTIKRDPPSKKLATVSSPAPSGNAFGPSTMSCDSARAIAKGSTPYPETKALNKIIPIHGDNPSRHGRTARVQTASKKSGHENVPDDTNERSVGCSGTFGQVGVQLPFSQPVFNMPVLNPYDFNLSPFSTPTFGVPAFYQPSLSATPFGVPGFYQPNCSAPTFGAPGFYQSNFAAPAFSTPGPFQTDPHEPFDAPPHVSESEVAQSGLVEARVIECSDDIMDAEEPSAEQNDACPRNAFCQISNATLTADTTNPAAGTTQSGSAILRGGEVLQSGDASAAESEKALLDDLRGLLEQRKRKMEEEEAARARKVARKQKLESLHREIQHLDEEMKDIAGENKAMDDR